MALDALDNYQAKVPPSDEAKLIKNEIVKEAVGVGVRHGFR